MINRDTIYDLTAVLPEDEIIPVDETTPAFRSQFDDGVNPQSIITGRVGGNIESYNFNTGSAGYKIDKDGSIEANSGTFRGALEAGSIHIPDQDTTANSFHTNTTGDSWWGATETDFNTSNANADAYILNTGQLYAANATITGSITISSGSGISNLSDAGALAVEDDLDGVPDGTNYGKIATTDISSGHITVVSSSASININDTTFGNQGIQLQYNSGTPRAYIGDGSTKFVEFDGTNLNLGADTTLNGRTASVISGAIDASGHFIDTALDTSAKEILSDFTFGASGAIKMITDASNGLWLSPTGILGKKSGNTTFSIDTSGDATFAGTLSAATGSLGTITTGLITLDSSGYIKGGQTAYDTGTGFFLGYDTDAYKLSIGDSSDIENNITWNGTNLIVNGSGINFNNVFGDGSDGSVTISSNTTLTSDMYYDDLTINSGVTLTTGGYRIFVKGTLTNEGTIEYNGNNGSNGTNGTDASGDTSGSAGTGGSEGSALPGGSLSGSVAGIAGGDGGGTEVSGSNAGAGNDVAKAIGGDGVTGAGGGAGGDSGSGADGGAGGAGGSKGSGTGTIYNMPHNVTHAILMQDFVPSLDFLRPVAGSGGAGGAGGGGQGDQSPPYRGGGGAGGGAGGSGGNAGLMTIVAKKIINNGSITVTGGAGGNGGDGGDGGTGTAGSIGDGGGGGGGAAGGSGGSGGVVVYAYSKYSGALPTADGGAGGTEGVGGAAGDGHDGGTDGNAGSIGTTGASGASGALMTFEI